MEEDERGSSARWEAGQEERVGGGRWPVRHRRRGKKPNDPDGGT